MTQQETFNAAYWASQPAEIAALSGMATSGDEPLEARKAVAERLALAGFVIDVWIHVYGEDPYRTMAIRKDYGYAWVPSALMPPPVGNTPGLGLFPGAAPVDYTTKDIPPMGIRVSLDPADYPPIAPLPAPPVQAAAGEVLYVGPRAIGRVYHATAAAVARFVHDQVHSEGGKTYRFSRAQGPVAPFCSWVEQ